MKVRTHEKFSRQIADNLGIFVQQCFHRIDKEVLHSVPERIRYCKVVIIQACSYRSGALFIKNIVGKCAFKLFYTFFSIVVFLF